MSEGRRRFLLAALASTGAAAAGCQPAPVRRAGVAKLDVDRLAQGYARLAARARPGILNLAVAPVGGATAWCADPQGRCPLAAIGHLPVAAAALAQIDLGRLSLNERLRVGAGDLGPPPSRINRLFAPSAGGDAFDIPTADLIALAVQEGDDTAADALLRRLGGPAAVTGWLRSRAIAGMTIDRYAREVGAASVGLPAFQSVWAAETAWAAAAAGVPAATREAAVAAYLADPRDCTTAPAVLALLTALAAGALLSRASMAFLLDLMATSKAGSGRLAAGLPPDASLAHVSAASNTVMGLTAATHDVGLVRLADGRAMAIVALLSGSTDTGAQRDQVIADAARLSVSSLA